MERIGLLVADRSLSQEDLDQLLEQELIDVAKNPHKPLSAKKRIAEALEILEALGLPPAQQNDRSALTLLALLDVKPKATWTKSNAPLMGITPIIEFIAEHYGLTYAPKTRVKQFVGKRCINLWKRATYNPDQAHRPVNSPNAVYQIAPLLLDVLRAYGTSNWETLLKKWLAKNETLKVRYAQERQMAKIPLQLSNGQKIELSPGGQNLLVEKIVHEFCPRFTPGAVPLYIGDTEEKYAFIDQAAFKSLGLTFDAHGKMPDVVIHFAEKNWLILLEAVTSHGPVDGRDESKRLFAKSNAPLVYVTAFMNRSAMVKYLGDISWETEVWVADAPSHMIHFNGEHF